MGTEIYFRREAKKKIMKFATFYLMEWQKNLSRGFGFETEKIEWLSYKKARKKLSYSGEKKILDKAKKLLEAGVQKRLL